MELVPVPHDLDLRGACAGSGCDPLVLKHADESRRAFVKDPASLQALSVYRERWSTLRSWAHRAPWETSEETPLGFAWGDASLVEETSVVYVECTEFEELNLNACEVAALLRESAGPPPFLEVQAPEDEAVSARVRVLASESCDVLGSWVNLSPDVVTATPVCDAGAWGDVRDAFSLPVSGCEDLSLEERLRACRLADDVVFKSLKIRHPPKHVLDVALLAGRRRGYATLRANLSPLVLSFMKRRDTLELARQLASLLSEVSAGQDENEGAVLLERILFLKKELNVSDVPPGKLSWDRVARELRF